MNERIKELMKQAGGNPNYKAFRGHFLPPPLDYIDPATVDLAKFAELIVRECISQCNIAAVRNAQHGDSKEAHGCFSAKDRIKEHFGVEE